MKFECPVCLYPEMREPPQDYNICECCGTEFEAETDGPEDYPRLRRKWLLGGAKWWFRIAPAGWNAQDQIARFSG